MNLAALTLLTCLLAQVSEDPESFDRPVMRRRQSPAAEIDNAPADDRDDRRSARSEAEEPPAEEDRPGRYRQPAAEDDARERLAPLDSPAKQKLRPPELIAEALETPRQGALVGTPMTLREALARATTRDQQLKIAQAYWRLCATQADYHWARNERDLLGQYTQQHTNLPGTLSARASARAVVRDAQLAVTQAQQDLADLIGMRSDASPPLASDRPHVGDYNTHYESLFGSRVPPARLRLIHRTMPVRRRAIDAHGEAIVAALDALEVTGEELRQQGEGMATVLASLDQLRQQRRAFIEDVRQYNQEIAEYAFAVAPATANGDTLVSMLIKTSPRAAAPAKGTRAEDPRRATRATFETEAVDRNSRGGRDTEAPRFGAPPAAADAGPNELAPADSEPTEPDPISDDAPRDPPADRYRREHQQPTEAAPEGEAEPAANEHTSNYQGEADPESGEVGMYQGLVSVEGPARVQKLSNLLHWDRNLPRDAGSPVELVECLRGIAPAERLAVIDAFWNARQQAARCQVLAEHLEQLSALPSIAIGMRDRQGIAEVTVRVQAARKAARASLVDAQRDLIAAEFALTVAARRQLDGPWLLPATVPQGGRYIVSAGRPRRVDPRAMHWGEVVRVSHERLAERADAVVQADVNRAQLTDGARQHARCEAGSADEPMRLDSVLRAVSRQNRETLAFLQELTEYNKAIARFALVTWPENTAHDLLVKKLVIARSTRRDI